MCYCCMNCGKCSGTTREPNPEGMCPICEHRNPRMQGDAKRAEGRFRKRRGAHLAMQTNLRLPVNRETPARGLRFGF